MVSNITMALIERSISGVLRQAISEADSIRGVARATGLSHASLVRFVNGERSLRLDLADKVAAHLGIACVRQRQRKSR